MPMEGCSSNNKAACKQVVLDATLGAPRHLMLQHVSRLAWCPLCVCHVLDWCVCVHVVFVCVLGVYRGTHCPAALRTQRRSVYLLACHLVAQALAQPTAACRSMLCLS